MRVLGIDIGSYSIKCVELYVSNKAISVSKTSEYIFNLDPTHDKSILTLDFLRSTVKEYEGSNTRFALGVSQDKVSLRLKFFPFRERSKILRSLPFELEDELPLEQVDTAYDGKIVAFRPKGAEVLACACPKEHVEKLLKMSSDAGFDPDVISAHGVALGNLFESWQDLPPEWPEVSEVDAEISAEATSEIKFEQAKLYLHVGHAQSMLLALKGDRLIAVRTINWGARDLCESVAKHYKIPFADAIKEIQQKSFVLLSPEGASATQIQFSNLIAQNLKNLTKAIRLTQIHLSTEHRLQFTKIGFSGGGSQIRNFGPYLTQELEMAANPVDWAHLISSIKVSSGSPLSGQYAVALGIAIEAIKKPRNPPLNFRKDEFKKRNESMLLFWNKWKHTAQITATAFVLVLFYSIVRESIALTLEEEISAILQTTAQTVAGLKGGAARESAIQSFINNEERQKINREKLLELQKLNSAMDVLSQMSRILPPKDRVHLDVKRLDIQMEEVTLEGQVRDKGEFDLIQRALEGLSAKVQLLRTTPASGVFGFALKFKVNRI